MTTEQDLIDPTTVVVEQPRVQEILDMWRREGDPPCGGDPIALVQRAFHFHPFTGQLTKEDIDVLIEAEACWMQEWKDEKEAQLRELERVREIAWPALFAGDETPGCTLAEAMRGRAARGDKEAKQWLGWWEAGLRTEIELVHNCMRRAKTLSETAWFDDDD
jgi:hypothetical protein